MDDIWTKVDIFTTSEGVEPLSAALSDLGYDSVSVTDAADLKNLMDGKYGAWDYIEPELMKLNEAETTITLYLPGNAQSPSGICSIQKMLVQLKASDSAGKFGRLECLFTNIKDEDWADSWKDDYTPIIIGETFVVCPTWVDYDPGERKVIRIDPGMAFGTGLDVTTRLCLEALESIDVTGCSVLDIGCGSGILAIGALLLGATSALGIDLDEVAVKTAKENAGFNGLSGQAEFIYGSLFDIAGKTYDIICANISADVILSLMPEFKRFFNHDGHLILSGIIKDREQDIIDALLDVGMSVFNCKEESGWVCIKVSQGQGQSPG